MNKDNFLGIEQQDIFLFYGICLVNAQATYLQRDLFEAAVIWLIAAVVQF